MSTKKRIQSFEDLDVYRLAEELADPIWDFVSKWPSFAQNTVGYQIVKSADSIGANLAEGFGRFHFAENKQFARIARGSLYETRHWLRRASTRRLLNEEEVKNLVDILDELAPRLNAYIRSIGQSKKMTNDQ